MFILNITATGETEYYKIEDHSISYLNSLLFTFSVTYCTADSLTDGAQLLLFRSAISVDLHTNLGNRVHVGEQSVELSLR